MQPIEQEVTEFTATGERLQNLPPQQAPTDPNFDTDSYVRNLQRQIKEGEENSFETNETEDLLKNAEQVQVQPMKFDGKQIRVSNVNVVKAPKSGNKNIVPIVFVIILVIALIGIAVYIFAFSGLFKKPLPISFEKPDGWSERVCAIPYNSPDEFKSVYEQKDKSNYRMEKDAQGVYTFNVDSKYENGKIVFVDANDLKKTYPADAAKNLTTTGEVVGEDIVKDKVYNQNSQQSSLISVTESSAASAADSGN